MTGKEPVGNHKYAKYNVAVVPNTCFELKELKVDPNAWDKFLLEVIKYLSKFLEKAFDEIKKHLAGPINVCTTPGAADGGAPCGGSHTPPPPPLFFGSQGLVPV